MTPSEEWRPVVGYEGSYEVSDQGRVRSVDRYRPGYGGLKFNRGRVLKPVMQRDGRPQVTLRGGEKGASIRVHLLVAEAFLGPRPEGLHVCHFNGDPSDNRLTNLRYDTKSANELDKRRHGTHHNAVKTHCPQDHPYSPENTWVKDGKRFCKACAAESQRRRRARRRAPA